MDNYSHLKLLQITARKGDRPNGMESPKYDFCLDFMDEVDKFILKGLIRFQQPTKSHLDALIGDAYKQYLSSIMFVLNKHDESEFKQFCYNRYYYNKDQTIKVLGKLFTLKHINCKI